MKRYLVIFLSATFCLSASCRPAKTIADYSSNLIYLVNIDYLTDSISKYHGKTIQTKGFFSFGFENQSLTPAITIFDSTKNNLSVQVKSYPGLWIQFDDNFTIQNRIEQYETNKTGRLVTIQGVVDTMNTGHMGFYKAAIAKS
ncbi:hypothetical protein KJS94_14495 [Flavihumibacter rivuli]|uniref:hypothetical protein n=1 Tax=Flavihumibacter rivuli TaxID=2838156 RepID=UPI001BDDE06D|nr:hypothetical protein [Flavihumibacter rivuli]ULQ55856.1 hypothetical protein KJS94_14495 [Flavihumibacter rivuli]